MNQRVYRVLEYDKIIQQLKDVASSEITRNEIEGLTPSIKFHEIKEMQAETSEALTVIIKKGNPPIGNFYDIKKSLSLADKGGTLTMKQLLEVLYNIQVVKGCINFLKEDFLQLPRIQEIVSLMSRQGMLEENISRSILSEDQMADNASPQLKDIRRSILQQNESIRGKMNQILNSSENKTMLQDTIVTMRQGRYVLPVKQEHRSRFPGIIHDQSATGATLFIEPQVIVNLNNQLRELELAEKIEMERILSQLSAEVSNSSLDLRNDQELLLRLDFIFAKGKLSFRQNGVEPQINEEGHLKILRGRHPLLDPEKVVPIHISIGEDYRTLIITGPNTGGKTVTLKTVGLLALMTQAGLHVPASEGSIMPVFRKVFADIGDEQSIEQSLSTFSSHMKNIVNLLEESSPGTLVLLDELGAGTDPTEGAALAISILDNLYERGALTIATTHYTELKKYAISTIGVQNASMEFNVETLSPTYKLTIGTPGKSNAFEISQKLGLQREIIEKAKELLDKDDIKFEDVIGSIEQNKIIAEKERDEAIDLRIKIKQQKEELEKQVEKFEQKKDAILSKARAEAKEMVAEAKELFTDLQRQIKELEQSTSSEDRNKNLEKLRRNMKKAGDIYKEPQFNPINPEPITFGDIKIGQRVKVISLQQNGEIITLPDDKEEVMVQVGSLKVNVHIGNLMKIHDGTTKSKEKSSYRKYGGLMKSKTENIQPTINVRGENLDSAKMDVDKYLDDAFMAGLREVTVIHGRGEGILREGIHSMLKSHKHVKSFKKGAYNEGGDGVTVVQLK